MALNWKTTGGKEIGTIDGATNPAFIISGQNLEVRVIGAEQLSGERNGTLAEIKTYCSSLLAQHSIPLEGTQTQG